MVGSHSLGLTGADAMVAARTIGGPSYTGMIEEMDGEFTKIIEDFDRAMNFEALRIANETSELCSFEFVNG